MDFDLRGMELFPIRCAKLLLEFVLQSLKVTPQLTSWDGQALLKWVDFAELCRLCRDGWTLTTLVPFQGTTPY